MRLRRKIEADPAKPISLLTARGYHAATLTRTGQVVVTGGFNQGALGLTEFYDTTNLTAVSAGLNSALNAYTNRTWNLFTASFASFTPRS